MVIKKSFEQNLLLQEFLTTLTKEVSIQPYSMYPHDGPVVINPHRFEQEHQDLNKPIIVRNANLIVKNTPELSYDRWLLMTAHLVEKLAAAKRKSMFSDVESSSKTQDIIPLDDPVNSPISIYTLCQFVKSFDERLVRIDPKATDEELWGGKPTEIPVSGS